MSLKNAYYWDIRDQMEPGDVIAFGGVDPFSDVIKLATKGPVSHVGVVLQTKVTDYETGSFFNLLIESTGNGVNIVRLSQTLQREIDYKGYRGQKSKVWWLPLNDKLKNNKFDLELFHKFLFQQCGKEYDFNQAVKSAIDTFDRFQGFTYNKEDFAKFFCSELVAAGLEKSNLIDDINCSEVTPIDLCSWNIFEEDYYQLLGDEEPISRYNSEDPACWATPVEKTEAATGNE